MKIKEHVKKLAEKIATQTAEYYANVSCPLIMYQDKLPKEVKMLRRKDMKK